MQTKTANRHSQHAQAVVRYLQRRGAWTMRIRAGWGMRKGLPDILACWQGVTIAIEVKTGRGRLTPQQKRELEALRAAGAVVLVGDAEAVIRELEGLTKDPQEGGERRENQPRTDCTRVPDLPHSGTSSTVVGTDAPMVV